MTLLLVTGTPNILINIPIIISDIVSPVTKQRIINFDSGIRRKKSFVKQDNSFNSFPFGCVLKISADYENKPEHSNLMPFLIAI